MGLKWGDLLDGILQQVNKGYTVAQSKIKNTVDTSGISAATKKIEDLANMAIKLSDSSRKADIKLADAERTLGKLPKDTKAFADQLKIVTVLENRRKNLIEKLEQTEEQLQEETEIRILEEEKLNNALNKTANTNRRLSASFDEVEQSYQSSLKRLVEEGKNTEDAMDALKFDKIISNINAGLFNSRTEDLLNKGGEKIGAIVSETLSTVLPGPLADIIASAVIGAFNQALELNSALIGLERNMGGLIQASDLGFDSFGNSAKGMSSLASQAIAANVSVEQFGSAIKSLGPQFGQTIGMSVALGHSQRDLAKFGIEAARQQKLYGAEIGASVAKLTQNFGMSIGQATDMMAEGAKAAKVLGLNVGEFTKNFEQVVDLVGEVYFKSTEAMQQMATIATQLGTSVSAIANAVPKMQGINDLFKEQQKLASLGMSTTASAIGKIYALQKQGRSDEAARVALAAQAKDLAAQGLTSDTGNVTQQGIATLQAAGLGKEQIEALQKMSQQAVRTGLSFEQLGGQVKLTKEQEKKLQKDEANNVTVQEQANQMLASLKQSLIDPIAEIIGPLLKSFMNALQPVVKTLGSAVRIIFDTLDPIVGLVTETFNQISLAFQDVWNPISNLFKSFGDTFGSFMNTLKKLGSFIVQVVMIPFRAVAKIVGGVVSVFAKIWQVIATKLTPIFDKLSDLFEGGGTMIEDALGLIDDAFGWLADLIGGAVGFVIDGLIEGFKFLWDMVGDVIDILKEVLQPFVWLKDIIKDVIDWFDNLLGSSDNGEGMTPVDLRTGFSGEATTEIPNVPIAQAAIDFGSNNQAEEAKRLDKEQNQIFKNNTPVNITTNVKTDGLFSNEQQIKSPN